MATYINHNAHKVHLKNKDGRALTVFPWVWNRPGVNPNFILEVEGDYFEQYVKTGQLSRKTEQQGAEEKAPPVATTAPVIADDVESVEEETDDVESVGEETDDVSAVSSYADLSKRDLTGLCAERGLEFAGRVNKNDLIALLEEDDDTDTE